MWLDVNKPKDKWGPALQENRNNHRYSSDDFEPKVHYTPSDVFNVNLEIKMTDDPQNKPMEKNGLVTNAYDYTGHGQTNPGYMVDEKGEHL